MGGMTKYVAWLAEKPRWRAHVSINDVRYKKRKLMNLMAREGQRVTTILSYVAKWYRSAADIKCLSVLQRCVPVEVCVDADDEGHQAINRQILSNSYLAASYQKI